jgi:YbgC/YbaW family acyl-CoA thioester hydrolase
MSSSTGPVYTWNFGVRTYELNPSRQIKLTTFLNYMEEVATQASAALGFDYDWYMQAGTLWVARKHTIRFYAPLTYPNDLHARTWISDVRRVQSNREYRFHRASDNAPIFAARTNWVYINSTTLKPERIPDDIAAGVIHREDKGLEDLDTTIRDPIAVETPYVYSETRRAEWHEIDSAGHVNNAIYVAWAEEAIRNMLRAAGWAEERLTSAEFTMRPLSHEIEYLRSALYDEPISVSTKLTSIGQDRAAWQTEIRQAATEELLCKDACVRSFTDANGARSIPDDMLLALRRPST